jgi:hypothetical protein
MASIPNAYAVCVEVVNVSKAVHCVVGVLKKGGALLKQSSFAPQRSFLYEHDLQKA